MNKITEISQQTQNFMKNNHNYSNFAETNSILYAPAAHGNQYEENPSRHHGRICKDRLSDGLTYWTRSYFPPFRLGRAGNINHNFYDHLLLNYVFLTFPGV